MRYPHVANDGAGLGGHATHSRRRDLIQLHRLQINIWVINRDCTDTLAQDEPSSSAELSGLSAAKMYPKPNWALLRRSISPPGKVPT